jgi:hypothetical protein
MVKATGKDNLQRRHNGINSNVKKDKDVRSKAESGNGNTEFA